MAKETWGEAIDAELKGIAEGVLVYPFQVMGEMLKEAFTFGSADTPSDDSHYHCYPCRDENCEQR